MFVEQKRNTALRIAFPMIDSTNPLKFKSGLTVTIDAWSSDAAGAWATLAIAGSASEVGTSGIYELALLAAEMNHDKVIIKVSSTGAADSAMMFKMEVVDSIEYARDQAFIAAKNTQS